MTRHSSRAPSPRDGGSTPSGPTQPRGWQRNRDMWVRVLEKHTRQSVQQWNERIRKQRLPDEQRLRAWLDEQGVTGYAQSLLVMEQFGYPDFLLASPEELIDAQFADRPTLRPIFDAVIAAARELGPVVVQARKTYVSLVSPRRTFARVQATTRNRVDLSLRLEGQLPAGRLEPSKIHESMRLKVSLTAADPIDAEVRRWLARAYAENS
jgi:hypothetical protein